MKSKEQKRGEAKERQEKYNALRREEKINKLNAGNYITEGRRKMLKIWVIIAITILIWAAFWGSVIYVSIHFIMKYW